MGEVSNKLSHRGEKRVSGGERWSGADPDLLCHQSWQSRGFREADWIGCRSVLKHVLLTLSKSVLQHYNYKHWIILQLKSFFTDVKIQGATILHYAVRCGSTKAIDFILQKHKGRRNLTTKVKCLSREAKLYVDCMIVNFCLRRGQGRDRGWMANSLLWLTLLSVSSVQNL